MKPPFNENYPKTSLNEILLLGLFENLYYFAAFT